MAFLKVSCPLILSTAIDDGIDLMDLDVVSIPEEDAPFVSNTDGSSTPALSMGSTPTSDTNTLGVDDIQLEQPVNDLTDEASDEICFGMVAFLWR